jgi:hypothetical protein
MNVRTKKAVSYKTKAALQRIYGEVEIAKSRGYKHATYDGDRFYGLYKE